MTYLLNTLAYKTSSPSFGLESDRYIITQTKKAGNTNNSSLN